MQHTYRLSRVRVAGIGALGVATAIAGVGVSAAHALAPPGTNEAAWCTIPGQTVGVDDHEVSTPTIGPIWCP